MRLEILEKAKLLRERFYNIARDFDKEITKREVNSKWHRYVPKQKKVTVCAEDGSVNVRNYLGFNLYVVSGYAVYMEEKNDGNMLYKESVSGEINLSVIKKHKYLDAYLRTLMFLVELKSLLKLAKETKPDVVILDGTLSSKYITIFPKSDWFTEEEFEGKLAETSIEVFSYIKDILYKYDIVAFSEEIKDIVVRELEKRNINSKSAAILEATLSKLAYFEYLLLLYELFYKLDWKPLVIGLAKTSNLTKIFQKSVPDIRIFYKFADGLGYSTREYITTENIKWELSQIFEEEEKDIEIALRDVQISYFYAKYQSERAISLIEVYENPDLEINVEEILDILNYISVGGYPFVLKRADKEVRITNRDMDLIENILGLQNEVSGREGLD